MAAGASAALEVRRGPPAKTAESRTARSPPIPCGETHVQQTATNRYCNLNGPTGPRCQACMTDAHCANNMQMPPRLNCDSCPRRRTCRSCVTERALHGASAMHPGHDGNNTCQTRCTSDADCASQTTNRACNVATMMCVECQNNTHCAATPDGAGLRRRQLRTVRRRFGLRGAPGMPVCDATNNICVAMPYERELRGANADLRDDGRRTHVGNAEPTPIARADRVERLRDERLSPVQRSRYLAPLGTIVR